MPGDSEEHWPWFRAHRKRGFPSISSPTLVLNSDWDKGLEGAGAQNFPLAQHYHCCLHLADNFHTCFGLACQKLRWKAAFAVQRQLLKK
jgi:hypothetical protein